mmetsp:Transcript_14204/g.20290  ORF Transcript_14204/g.20290 Transcript_14204/m.20290 type:complete len:794 (-) Transcript_14204:120-2501(-)
MKGNGRLSGKSEASALENEIKYYLETGQRTTAYRCAEYRPTLETFSSVSFSDYVRGVLMGVPLEGVETQDAYFPSTMNDFQNGTFPTGTVDITTSSTHTDSTDKSTCKRTKTTVRNISTSTSPTIYCKFTGTNHNEKPIASDLTICTSASNHIISQPAHTGRVHSVDVEGAAAKTFMSNSTETGARNNKLEIETDVLPHNFSGPASKSDKNSNDISNTCNKMDSKSKPVKPLTIVTRAKSRQLISSETKNKSEDRIMTRSRSKPQLIVNSDKISPTASVRNLKRKRKKRGPPLLPDSLKLSDGINKVTAPKGWWDYAGISRDLTGREHRAWHSGGKLGDLQIPSPIKQCAAGIGGIYEFDMVELPPTTISQFRQKADEYRKRQIGTSFDEETSDEFMDNLARKFWRRLGPTMEPAVYGADMEGTLFDGAKACGWNVDKLDNCLELLRADTNPGGQDNSNFNLPGVTSAYLYIGMWASVFAAHTEDMNLLSINYLHAGAPKYWYAISQEDSGRFESLMSSRFSAEASSCSEFLRHKRCLLSPSMLSKAGICYTTQVQRPGDFIITFPGSYHFGFNTGFNVAESTNFAVPEWIPMGDQAKVCMCHPHSVRIDMERIKDLLEQYETDVLNDDLGKIKKMSYMQWAKYQFKLRKVDINPSCHDTSSTLVEHKLKGVPVEVMPPCNMKERFTNDVSKVRKKKVSKRRSSKCEKGGWRLALKVRKSGIAPQTPVLCLLECGDNRKDNFFAGTIISILEGYARIHFPKTSRKNDIWMSTDSNRLFVDGGSVEDPHHGKNQ